MPNGALTIDEYGIDPFRLRSGIWWELPRKEREKLFRALRKSIEEAIPPLEGYLKETDPVEKFLETIEFPNRVLAVFPSGQGLQLFIDLIGAEFRHDASPASGSI